DDRELDRDRQLHKEALAPHSAETSAEANWRDLSARPASVSAACALFSSARGQPLGIMTESADRGAVHNLCASPVHRAPEPRFSRVFPYSAGGGSVRSTRSTTSSPWRCWARSASATSLWQAA